MKKSQLQKYAKLIVRKGVNVQKGQDVRVRACPDQLDFVRMVVEECYKAGAGKVRKFLSVWAVCAETCMMRAAGVKTPS